MKTWLKVAGLGFAGALVLASSIARGDGGVREGTVVDIKTDRIVLLGLARAGDRVVAVGERGFALLSDDSGKSWRAVGTPASRTLTSVAFEDAKLGIAVGHGGTVVRTEDSGDTWTQVPMEEAEPESLLGVTSLGGGKFAAYGAFGMFFLSTDEGRTWTRRTVISEEFENHISQVIVGRLGLLGLVGEYGTLARSEDGGETWSEVPSPYAGSFFGVLQAKDDSLLAFGMRGSVFRSADAAISWQKIDVGTTTSLNGGGLLSDGRILLVGNAGLVVESDDNGQTLSVKWSPQGAGLSAVVQAPDGSIVVAGERGVGILDLSSLETK
ncbi:MAG: hypothetical protein RLZ98_3693 [Pseudomonadota bacterium]|jgi:photosystem II stability/assembly factor-like uncharacterized protein